MTDAQTLLSCQGIKKVFNQGRAELEILKGIDFQLHRGEAVCIMGPSGAGKSTLLHILGTLDRPSLGGVHYKDMNLTNMTDEKLAKFRSESLGFVFQFHHLLGEFTALENIEMPLRLGGKSKTEARKRAEELLEALHLLDRKKHFPSELSGGEKQRVAVARALANQPDILMADEPTGNLDTENDRRIQELFFDLRARLGLTLLVVSHEPSFAARFPRVLTLKDGQWSS